MPSTVCMGRPQAASGCRFKIGLESKMGGIGVFSGSYLPMGRRGSFCTARLPVIGHSGLPPFLFPGARQVRSRVKVLVGLGNGRGTKQFCELRTPP